MFDYPQMQRFELDWSITNNAIVCYFSFKNWYRNQILIYGCSFITNTKEAAIRYDTFKNTNHFQVGIFDRIDRVYDWNLH